VRSSRSGAWLKMCNFVQTGRGCVMLSRSSKLSLCRKELEAGGGQVRAAFPIGHPRRWHFTLPIVIASAASETVLHTVYIYAH
jgi:hypothetical protein